MTPPIDAAGPATRTLRVGSLTPVSHLVVESQEYVSAMVLWQVFERPFAPPAGGRLPEPVLFDGPLVREGAGALASFTAGLRPGITFSDGTPMTPQHVAQALARSESFTEQAAVAVRGDRVVFQLKRPNPRFDLVLTQTWCAISLERPGQRPLGSGPFVIAEGGTPERTRLLRNPRYRSPVAIEELLFVCYPPTLDHRPDKLLRALDEGEVDFSNVLSRDDVSRLKNVRKTFQPGASTAILYLNTERPALRDPSVRRALAHAINRDEIARTSYSNALAFAASSLLPPALDSTRDGSRFSPERAQEELGKSGVTFPSRLKLLQVWGPRPYLPHPRPVSDLIARQLRALGLFIEVVETKDAAEFYEVVARGDYDFALAGWIADTADPADFLEALLSSELVPQPGRSNAIRNNLSRLRSPAMDAALKRHREDPSTDNRGAILTLVQSEAPLVPLMYGPTIYVHSRRLKNFSPPAIGFPSFAAIQLAD